MAPHHLQSINHRVFFWRELRHDKIALTQARGKVMAACHWWMCEFVNWKARKQERKQTVPLPFHKWWHQSRSMRLGLWQTVWEQYAEQAVNTCVCSRTRRGTRRPVTDVMNTPPSLTSQSQLDTHVRRCFAACNHLNSGRNKETCNLSLPAWQ